VHLHVSERRACVALGQHRSTQRKVPRGREDAERLTADVIELAQQYGRYGYRKIAALLRQAGWLVSDTRVERIWRREGLKVPQKQPKRARLWLTDGSCIRLRPEHPNHIWSTIDVFRAVGGTVRRREFIGLVGSAAALPVIADAQQRSLPVIGFVDSRSIESMGNRLRGFRRGLEETGYTEGRMLAIEYRWAENRMDGLPDLVADLVNRHVDVIVASGGLSGAFAAKAATPSIPIVFLAAQDPVKLGLVGSLARPGGNLTGVNFFNTELAAKQFELLREILPQARRIAVLVDPADQTNTEVVLHDVDAAARANSVQIKVFKAHNSHEIDAEFEAMAQEHFDGLFIEQAPFLNSRRVQLVQLAAHYSIPAVYSGREFAEVGGLISYGSDIAEAYRQVGIYCGRILKGAKPAELPIMQSSKLELTINAQTARMLKLPLSPQLLARADEVIE
jgi:putative tryptophan/tyrosine transport system substrate-binding protein